MLQGSLNKGDAASSASGLYSFNSKGNSFIHSILNFIYTGISAAAIPARLRLRKNFGERAFSPATVILAVSFYLFVCGRIVYLFSESRFDTREEYEREMNEKFMLSLGLVFLLLTPTNSFSFFIFKTLRIAYQHFKKVYSHNETDKYVYSYYRGEPINNDYKDKIGKKLFGYKVDEKIIRIYYEHQGLAVKSLIQALISLGAIILLAVLGIGINKYIYSLDILDFILILPIYLLLTYSLSCLCLAFSSLCLLIEEISIEMKIRDTILDMIDGEYDLQFVMKQKELLASKYSGDPTASMELAEEVFQHSAMTFSPFADTAGDKSNKEQVTNSSFSPFTISVQNDSSDVKKK